MCHGNSENSYGCSYLLRICFIYGTNVIVSRSWIPLQVVDREQGAFWFTNKRVQITILSIFKHVLCESLAENYFSERGTQAEGHCERNLNRQLWGITRKISHPCSRNFCSHYSKGEDKTWTRGPWTPTLDRVHGPLSRTGSMKVVHGPGPWTPCHRPRP